MVRLLGALVVFAILFVFLLLGLQVASFMGHSFTVVLEPVWRWLTQYFQQNWGKTLTAGIIALLVTWRLFAPARHDSTPIGSQQPVIPPAEHK